MGAVVPLPAAALARATSRRSGQDWRPRRGRSDACATASLRAVVVRSLARATMPPGQRGPRARVGVPRVADPTVFLRAAAAALHDRRAVRVPALGLAGLGAADRTVRVGPAGRAARLARRVDRPIVLVTTSSEFQDDGRLVTTRWRHSPTRTSTSSPRCPRPSSRRAASRRTLASSPSSPTRRSSRARRAPSPTAARARPRRRSPRGVPVCVVPFGRDQLEVARRVELAGAGTRLPARGCAPTGCARSPAGDGMCAGARRVADGFAPPAGRGSRPTRSRRSRTPVRESAGEGQAPRRAGRRPVPGGWPRDGRRRRLPGDGQGDG